MKAKCSLYWLIFNVPNQHPTFSSLSAILWTVFIRGQDFFCQSIPILSIACLKFHIADLCIKCFRSEQQELLSEFFGFSSQSFTLLSHCVCKGCPIYTLSLSELIFFWMPAGHWSVYTLKSISQVFRGLFSQSLCI